MTVRPVWLYPLFLAPALGVSAQAPQACGTSPTILPSARANIFSEQQEQWLGDAEADLLERNNRPVKDPRQNAYLETIGKRLLAALPNTTLQFHFVLVDSSEVNGFSLAGGRVYITRKLVARAETEDDVAGVIAHEMGHILTHQFAYETTADLKRLLNISSVGDRADIYAKFQLLEDARMRDKHPSNSDSDDKQDQADRVAVYTAAAAGYNPQAYADFWNRAFFLNNKTGNGFSDFFGFTKPDEKRLRQLKKLVADLPPGCGTASTGTTTAFQHWHNDVVANQAGDAVAVESAAEVQLTPQLRPDVDRVRFSRDGRYILAQDENSIVVATREPLAILFRFDAERALPAEFTPDSREIVFHTPGLHVERWSIAERRLVTANEVVVHEPCIQTVLSPDGRTLACIAWGESNTGLLLSLIDVPTGSTVFEKKGWFTPSYAFDMMLAAHDRLGTPPLLVASSFSSDGNTMLIGPALVKLAFDLRTRTPIKIGGALKSEVANVYAFQGDDKIVGEAERPGDSGIFSFPDGRRLQQVSLHFRFLHSVTRGDLVLMPGPTGYSVGAADLGSGKFRSLSKTPALDIWGEDVVVEDGDGSLLLYKLGAHDDKESARLRMPQSPLGPTRSVSLSPDGHYLAFSALTRSGIWDLQTGRQLFLLRGFNAASWNAEGKLFAEFPEKDKIAHQIAEISVAQKSIVPVSYKMEDSQHLEGGRLLQWKADGKKNTTTLTAFSAGDNSIQWTRSFPEDQSAQTTNQPDNDLLIGYSILSTQARTLLRADATLQSQANAVKHKEAGRLIEIADPATGKVRLQVVVEVPLSYTGVEGFTRVGDLLYLSAGDNRTIVYSTRTGLQIRQIFGLVVSADPTSQRVALLNRRDELLVYDRDGAQLRHLSLGSSVRFAALLHQGTHLTVLTADQKVRRFDLNP